MKWYNERSINNPKKPIFTGAISHGIKSSLMGLQFPPPQFTLTTNMSIRKLEQCTWCNGKLLVPVDAQMISCPRCRRFSYILPIDYGRFPGILDGNSFDNPQPRWGAFLRPQVVLSSPPVNGHKRAVLCGVSYKNHPTRLHGSINDVMCMKSFLVQRFGFPDASIIVLTEEEKDPFRTPTKQNIRRALSWLVHGCQAGDSLVFHYSGHAAKVLDDDGDEIDGYDEALCPVDFKTQGKILDDELNATIVNPLTRGVKLHAIIDTCFSGTFLDLPYMCRISRKGYEYLWENQRIPFSAYKGTRGGLAISISACDDHQKSGDTTAFTGAATGALTYSLIKTIENEPTLTYAQLLIALRKKIHGVRKAVGQNGPFASSSSQEPQLSASKKFDVNSKLFI